MTDDDDALGMQQAVLRVRQSRELSAYCSYPDSQPKTLVNKYERTRAYYLLVRRSDCTSIRIRVYVCRPLIKQLLSSVQEERAAAV